MIEKSENNSDDVLLNKETRGETPGYKLGIGLLFILMDIQGLEYID